ncbi:hypothetical protein F2Q69_00055009 [Brassica cretica]|uniref:Uncharacterized protein n=1 Tax=Brassica cretica TaxID=69181 RepID=A0A8S9MY56_BRACR|nr:hypothetical protein F2Q69_00055009 [Brassica cretica]
MDGNELNSLLQSEIEREKREKGDLRLDPAYGRRVSVRAGVGTFLLPSKGFLLLLLRRLPLSALSELWIGAIIQGGFLAWRDDALAWRPWREKFGLHVRVVVPGDGGYHKSVDAGFSPGGGGSFSFADAGSSSREGEVISAPSSPVLAPEGRVT